MPVIRSECDALTIGNKYLKYEFSGGGVQQNVIRISSWGRLGMCISVF